MNDKTILSAVAVGVLGMLEGIAMLTGNDGTYFTLIVASIAGIAGYSIGAVHAISNSLCQEDTVGTQSTEKATITT